MEPLRHTVVLWSVLFASSGLCFEGAARGEGLQEVHATVHVEAHAANRDRGPYRLAGLDKGDAVATNIDQMPLDVTATTIQDCAFAGVFTRAHVDVQEVQVVGTDGPIDGVEIHIDMMAVLFPFSRYYDRSKVRATVAVEFDQTRDGSWGFGWELGGRLAPSGWRPEGEYGLTDEPRGSVVVERFVSGSSDDGPERWEPCVTFEIGSFPYEGGHYFQTEMKSGRYRMWIELERVDLVWPGDQIKQVEDGVMIRFFFN